MSDFFDYYKCPCSGKIVQTDFCPHCGSKTPVKLQGFRYEGMVKHTGTYAVKTKEFREPRKGELYLSGCKGFEFAYKAPNDLSQRFRIMKVVQKGYRE